MQVLKMCEQEKNIYSNIYNVSNNIYLLIVEKAIYNDNENVNN